MEDTADRYRAVRAYQSRSTKNLAIRFYPTDMEMLDFIKSHRNIAAYIKGLVADDMRSCGMIPPAKFRDVD